MILIINKDIFVFCYCQKLLSNIQLLKEPLVENPICLFSF